jgi:hypothetical protein
VPYLVGIDGFYNFFNSPACFPCKARILIRGYSLSFNIVLHGNETKFSDVSKDIVQVTACAQTFASFSSRVNTLQPCRIS